MRIPKQSLLRAAAPLSALWTIMGCAASHQASSSTLLCLEAPPRSEALAASAAASSEPAADCALAPLGQSRPADDFALDDAQVVDLVSRFEWSRRAFFHDALERSGRYWTDIVAILADEGVPIELAYVPLIESGYRTSDVSPAGAVGLWQLTAATARHYGLRVDRHVDQRRDPRMSTRAAARYLRDLHATFGSWDLSLAAYNVGPARVAHALRPRRGATTAALTRLPRAARNYVAQFIAALRIAGAPSAREVQVNLAGRARWS
jgi:membrane-bound lytic murein transglycosylase D